jgi:ATP-dependent Lhr-like helicase
MLPLSFDLAMEIQRFRRLMDDMFTKKKSIDQIKKFISEFLYVDKYGMESIYKYFDEQFKYAEVPHDHKIVIEVYTEQEKTYFIFHTLFGRRVNDVLSRAVAYAISRTQHVDVEIGINDNGFYIASEKKIQALRAFSLLKADELRKVAEKAIDHTEILKRRFRHCAGRALMILRQYKGRQKRVGRQQVSSMILMNAVKRISPKFAILQEAKREVLEDLMDIENATFILKQIEQQRIRIREIHTTVPSPFAFNLVAQGFTDVMKIEDRIAFIRRMHKHVLAKIGKDFK